MNESPAAGREERKVLALLPDLFCHIYKNFRKSLLTYIGRMLE